MTTFLIDLHDRAGALERLLNVCRRKKFHVHTLQYGPGRGPGLTQVAVAFDCEVPPARIAVNLARILDVVGVEEVEAQAHAEAAQATLAPTRAA